MASSFGTAPPGSAAAVRSRLFGNKRAMTVLATCLALVSLFLFVIFLGSSSSASWSSGWARGRRDGGASLPLRGGGGTPRRSYVLVIDCGSSGTRMNAFEIGRSSSTGGPRVPVVIPSSAAPAHLIPKRSTETRRAYQRVETEPGLSTFVRDDRLQDVDGEALQPLLAWAKAVVPSVHWADTPVYLLGTAGLRRLEEDEQERVLGACREVLERSPFRFENSYARVIDGNDEGIYGWAALNAAEGRLLVGGPPRGGSRSRATIGALDLGGSSLEVTYEDDDDEGGVDEGGSVGGGRSTEIRIGDVTYRVRTHSYAGAGLDDAYAAGLRMARDGGERTPAVVRHPCLHRGYETNETNETNETAAESLTQEERTKRKTDAPVRGAAYEDGTNRACYRLAEEVVDGLEVVIASSSRRFAAMSGFYVINRFFGLDTSATLDDVRKATDSFCAMEWDSVLTRHKDELAVETYCFRGTGIGLNRSEPQASCVRVSASLRLAASLSYTLSLALRASLGVLGRAPTF